jgi:hypothetical protein
MADTDLIQACKEACASFVKEQIEQTLRAADTNNGFFWTAPFIGVEFLIGRLTVSKLDKIEEITCNAIAAQIYYQKHGPSWLFPLPIRYNLIEAARQSSNPFEAVTGFFARSLWHEFFNVHAHSAPDQFARGLMACDRCPARLRENPELLAAFNPAPIVSFFRPGGPPPHSLEEQEDLIAITNAEITRRFESWPREILRTLANNPDENADTKARAKRALRRRQRPNLPPLYPEII